MTLSQIIARQGYFDKEIPDKGTWKVRVVIRDGKIDRQSITEEREQK